MNDKWVNIKGVASRLGDDLDIKEAWKDFDKRKKRRRIPIWILFGIVAITALIVQRITLNPNHDLSPKRSYSQSEKTDVNTKEQGSNISKSTKIGEGRELSSQVQENNSIRTRLNNQGSGRNEVVTKRPTWESTQNSNFNDMNVISEVSGEMRTRKSQGLPIGTEQLSTSDHEVLILEQDVNNNDVDIRSNQSSLIREKKRTESPLDKLSLYSDIGGIKLESLEYLQIDLDELDIPAPNIQLPYVKIPIESLTFNRWNLQFEYGIAQSYRSLNTPSDDAFSERRKNEEKLLEHQTFRVLGRYNLGKKHFISTGLMIGQHRSMLEDRIQNILLDVIYQDQVVSVIVQDGVQTPVLGEVVGSQTIITQKVRFQRYFDLSLPILIGIQLPIGKKSSFELATGLNFGLSQIVGGNTYESATSIGTYQPLSNIGYRSFGLLGIEGSVDFVTEWKDNLHVKIGVRGVSDINSRIEVSNTTEKVRRIGMNIGFLMSL